MNKELFFLRSSEQKIVKDMTKNLYQNEENIEIYYEFYGLTTKDLGLYALVDNKIAGAIWSRKFNKEQNAKGFVDENIPIVNISLLKDYSNDTISFMLEQFLIEASALYEQLSIYISEQTMKDFYKSFGFTQLQNSNIFIKKLEKKEIIRPTDGYDPSKWMD